MIIWILDIYKYSKSIKALEMLEVDSTRPKIVDKYTIIFQVITYYS